MKLRSRQVQVWKAPAQLTRDLRRVIKRGHPWVYADAVRLPRGIRQGDWVEVVRGGRGVAWGYADPDSALAVRVVTTGRPRPGVLVERLGQALALRERLYGDNVTGIRLVNGEGDGLPGLVVDRYGEVLVIRTDGPAAAKFWDVEAVAERLHETLKPQYIYLRERSRGGAEGRPLIGGMPPRLPFQEGAARLFVEVDKGQKTGYFLDQREHRMRVGGLAKGKRVLNLFGYTGGFSIHAGLGGAAEVTTVDIAEPAIEEAQRAWAENGLDPALHQGVAMDVFAFLEEREGPWDLIVLDPPAFAPNRESLGRAKQAYTRLVKLAAERVAPQGLLVVGSCSAHVSQHDFMHILDEGISQARRQARLLILGGQPPDHPYPLACEELAYLKVAFLNMAD